MKQQHDPKKAVSILREMYLGHNRRRFPKLPEYARVTPKYSDKTANGLTKMIIDFIQLSGGQAERINCAGRPIDRRFQIEDSVGRLVTVGCIEYVKTTGTRGTADISATIKGRSVKIEVKIGKDKQSLEQIQYQQRIESAGGIYFVAKDFGSFYNWYLSIFLQP